MSDMLLQPLVEIGNSQGVKLLGVSLLEGCESRRQAESISDIPRHERARRSAKTFQVARLATEAILCILNVQLSRLRASL